MLDYTVLMDDNNDSFYDTVATGLTSASHIENGLTPGNPYKFKVQARNAVGSSPDSVVFTIYAATVPSQPAAPTTSLNGDSSLVIINWSEPTDNGGVSIDGYKVEIETSVDGVFSKDTLNCDAETDEAIILATSCPIPVATLRSSPFNLADGATVIARVTAFNQIGDSITSPENVTGAVIPAS